MEQGQNQSGQKMNNFAIVLGAEIQRMAGHQGIALSPWQNSFTKEKKESEKLDDKTKGGREGEEEFIKENRNRAALSPKVRCLVSGCVYLSKSFQLVVPPFFIRNMS